MNILVFLLKHPLYLKCKIWVDGIFSIASLLLVPGLVVVGVVWTVQPTSNIKVLASNTYLSLTAGEVAKIKPEVNMRVSGPRVVYRLQLVDKSGDVVYNYPEETVENDNLKLDTVNVRVPKEVSQGEYSLVASVKYLGNPIQTNSVQLDLAHITVGSSDSNH